MECGMTMYAFFSDEEEVPAYVVTAMSYEQAERLVSDHIARLKHPSSKHWPVTYEVEEFKPGKVVGII